MIALLLPSLALATPGFNPAVPGERFTGDETYTADGDIKLWSAIERLEDSDRDIFLQEAFNTGTAWPDSVSYAPFIKASFRTATPHSSTALLHMGLREEVVSGTPILFVPGAGDNGSRSWITMATRFDNSLRPVYALTFAHPHGDTFMQAEMIANAIARIKQRTGAAQVDVVSHSKGGIATAVYLSNDTNTEWPNEAYTTEGTTYRGDVRRAVFIATPLDGIDTAYRWPSANLYSLDEDAAISPSSWGTYYPYGTSSPAFSTDLSGQDLLPDGADLFPGQRQIYKRQPYDLPGSMPELGAYSLQQDWYTTYEGGFGFYSHSDGIDAAVEAGGNLIDTIANAGVDPNIELFLVAGKNPLMPNGADDYMGDVLGDAWSEVAEESTEAWSSFLAALVDESLLNDGYTTGELKGLANGDLVLGEISGESDGLVFLSSSLHAEALTKRGAVVKETYTANLSHIDLLYASPITGQLLIDSAAGPEDDWMKSVGERYIEADTLGWVERVLQDPEGPDDTGDTGDTAEPQDSGDTGDVDTDTGRRQGLLDGCEGCNASGGLGGAPMALLLGLIGFTRRRRVRRPTKE